MSLWEGKQAKAASKYAIYGTIAGGLAKTASAGMDFKKSLNTKKYDTTNAPKAYTVD